MSPNRLRVLIVTPSLPFPSWGFATRVHQLARYLSLRHDVTVLSYFHAEEDNCLSSIQDAYTGLRLVPREPAAPMARRFAQVLSLASVLPFQVREVKSASMQDAIDELFAEGPFDIVQLESAQIGYFRLPRGVPVVLDEHNVEYELLQRMHQGERSLGRRVYNHIEHLKVRRLEQRLWRAVDAVAVTSDREQAIVQTYARETETAVVPNGADVAYFAPSEIAPRPGTIVFTGLLTYRPNLDAAYYLVEEVVPRIRRRLPEILVTLVGHGLPADMQRLRRPGVTVTGRVPDVRPYLAEAAVVVAPLRIGSGTRLKVVEALAMGRPVVSTSVGCEGLDVRNGYHLSVADGPDRFASAVVDLLLDSDAARRLGIAGRALAVAEYSWDRAGSLLEDLHYRVTSSTGSVARAAKRPSASTV